MPRKSKKSKKSKVKINSNSDALHIRKINDIPVLTSRIRMNLSPHRLHVSSCKNGNFKSQSFKNPRQFIDNLQHNNMSIHDTLAHLQKNKKTNFYHKPKPKHEHKHKPIFNNLPPIIRIHKHTRKLTPYPKKLPTKKVVPKKPPVKKVVPKKHTKTDKKKILKKLAESLKQLEKTM
jgi:hypothetical protein